MDIKADSAAGTTGFRNTLLNLLPPQDFDRLRPMLRRVEIRPRQVLHHWRMPMEHVYFIESGLVSVAARVSKEAFVEVWLTGSEGMTGIPVVLGDNDDPPHRRVVQVGGTALKMGSQDLRSAVAELPALRTLLLRYAEVVLLQTSQSGACNAHHELRRRISRWLLLARDSLKSETVPLTHEVMGRLLGVRRASVSECLGVLEAEGLIDMRRGLIRIKDGSRLEAAGCDCYRIIRREYHRLLPG